MKTNIPHWKVSMQLKTLCRRSKSKLSCNGRHGNNRRAYLNGLDGIEDDLWEVIAWKWDSHSWVVPREEDKLRMLDNVFCCRINLKTLVAANR